MRISDWSSDVSSSDLDVALLAVAADVVGLAGAALGQHRGQGAGVVFDVQQVAHVLALAVDRQRPALPRREDHQRDALLGKMVGGVVFGDRRSVGWGKRGAERVGTGGLRKHKKTRKSVTR